MFYYLLLALTRGGAGAEPRCCCAGASAITGWRSARTRRRREALGINAFRYKLAAVTLSAALTAVGGRRAWPSTTTTSIPTIVFATARSVEIITAPIIGGIGTLFGPIVGAFVLTGARRGA